MPATTNQGAEANPASGFAFRFAVTGRFQPCRDESPFGAGVELGDAVAELEGMDTGDVEVDANGGLTPGGNGRSYDVGRRRSVAHRTNGDPQVRPGRPPGSLGRGDGLFGRTPHPGFSGFDAAIDGGDGSSPTD